MHYDGFLKRRTPPLTSISGEFSAVIFSGVAFSPVLLRILQVAPIDVSSLISFTGPPGATGLRGPPEEDGGAPSVELKVFRVLTALMELILEWPLAAFSGGRSEPRLLK